VVGVLLQGLVLVLVLQLHRQCCCLQGPAPFFPVIQSVKQVVILIVPTGGSQASSTMRLAGLR
jgi:hypothetical protein